MSAETPETRKAWDDCKHNDFPHIAGVMFEKSQALERRNSELTAELEDLRQFKKEVDGEGVVPATRVLDKERQVSELTARIAELERALKAADHERDFEREVTVGLESKLAETRKDSARIQKLEAIGKELAIGMPNDKDPQWWFFFDDKDRDVHGPTLRATIDLLPATPLPETEGTI